MNSPYKKEITTAIKAVQQAAKISRTVLSDHDLGIISKDDLSPVTVADFAIQALLTAIIHAAFPADQFVGEESSKDLRANPKLLDRVWNLLSQIGIDQIELSPSLPKDKSQMCEMIDWCGQGEPGGHDRVWIFDPIDGTKTFVRGEMYAVNIALLEKGKQVVSVVGLPLLSTEAQAPIRDDTIDPKSVGSILFAAEGHGTHIRPLDRHPEDESRDHQIPLHAAAEDLPLTALRSVTCYGTLDSGIDSVHEKVAKSLGIAFPFNDLLGWVPRWAILALGHANTTVWVYKKRTRRGKIWDHAGAMLLFEETGGKITDIMGRNIDLTVGRTLSANFGFVAAPKCLHKSVLETVQRVVREEGKGSLLEDDD